MTENTEIPLKKQKIVQKAVPWVEKYRPESLNDLVSHQDIIQTLNSFIFPKNINQIPRLPHLLLYGPPGTGKTSTILAIAKQLFSSKSAWNDHVLELNASDDRGIDVVRNKIVNFVQMKCIVKDSVPEAFWQIKIVILDEADAMTKDAQNALRRIIEKYTKTSRFCLICNYISKIIPAIQSRCTRFRFGPLSSDQMQKRVEFIISKENIEISNSGITALVNQAQGDMRRALNVLQAVALSNNFKNVTEDSIYNLTGQPTPKEMQNIFEILLNEDVESSYKKLCEVKDNRGLALQDMLEGLHTLLLEYELDDLILAKIIQRMAEIEWRLSKGCNDNKQLGCLIAAFTFLRENQINKDLNKEVNDICFNVTRSF